MASALVCATLPTTTWPKSSTGTPACAIAAFAACTPSSVAERSLSVPPKVPKGVRFAARMTRSFCPARFMAPPSTRDKRSYHAFHGEDQERDRERDVHERDDRHRPAARLAAQERGGAGAVPDQHERGEEPDE